MKFNVPFRRQGTEFDCGPAALLMALDYLGLDKNMEEVKEILDYTDGMALYTVEMAAAASNLGLEADFYTALPSEDHDWEFYEEHTEEVDSEELYREAEEAGAELNFESLELDELLNLLTDSSIPIVLIDWNTIIDEDGYQGHFVPIVGYNDSKVYIHEPGSQDGDYMKIQKETFNEARKAEGTDQDIAVIKNSNL